MTAAWKRRRRRRKLAAHDRGEDRHNKGLALLKKQYRLRTCRRVGGGDRPGKVVGRAAVQPTTDAPPIPKCQRKSARHSPDKCFPSQRLAEAMCEAVANKHGTRLYAYRCPHAEHWHVTARQLV